MEQMTIASRRGCRFTWPAEFIIFYFLLAPAAPAQLPTATILGVVKDASGAVIPEAKLTARSVDTGQVRTGTSGGDGSYRFAALPVGKYEVRVEHPGFQTAVRSGLTLTVAQEAVVNFALEVGAIEQTLSVTAEAPLVNTTSGSLGALVDEQRVAELPLNGRNYVDLTLLQAGIQHWRNTGSTSGVSVSGAWFSSNGAPVRSNNYVLDGAIMQDLSSAATASISGSTLGLEGIREYRVITNSFSAEYGMKMGSQMVIVSKSGTNAFHGSLFEYLRNSALDARNFFDRKTAINPRRLPPFAKNNFGVSFGGPIQRDRTFFHAVYEANRERVGRSLVGNVIPPSAKVDGGLVPQIDPRIKPLLALFPDPNLSNDQFTFPFSERTTENFGQTRMDHTVSNADTIFGRYTVTDTEFLTPRAPFPGFPQVGTSRSHFATGSETHIVSPVLLNTLRFSYSRTGRGAFSPSGISGPQFSFMPGEEIGTIDIGGVSGYGPNTSTPSVKSQHVFTWSDDVFYTRGRHSLKLGGLLNHYRTDDSNATAARGELTFPNVTSFLLAQPSRYRVLTPGSRQGRRYRYNTLGFFLQDDLRVTPRFSLNLGLRYEFHTEFIEADGYRAALRDMERDAETTLGRLFENPSLRNFSPRFGFAWDLTGDGKTALRGGFGLLYDVAVLGSALSLAALGTPPFTSNSAVTGAEAVRLFSIPLFIPPEAAGKELRTLDYRVQQPHMLQYNVTVERQLPFAAAVSLAYGGSRGINIVQTQDANPRVPQILPDGRQFWTGSDPRRNPYWDSIEMRTAGGNSWYNSLQVVLSKRLSRGLQFQSAYTWAKVIDETQAVFGAEISLSEPWFPVDPAHRDSSRGPAAFDTTHNLRYNAIYRLPQVLSSGGAAAKMLNGWWLTGILSLQSGFPFTPVLQVNRSRSGVAGGRSGIDRPDLAPGKSNNPVLGGADRYFDPSAFRVPPNGFLGNLGRNTVRSPGFANLDFSVAKDTPLGFLGESGKLEFRAEFFNLLNRVNFNMPDRTVYAARADVEPPLPTAGRITLTSGTARQIQFALKLVF